MQLYSGEDSLEDSFPHALEKMEGARRYISAFQAPLQELSPAQVHALRACSLLVIPPPKEGGPPPGGFPKDLSDLNLSSWAGLVQDVTSGLMAPPPTLGSEVSLVAVALLDLLGKATGWVYCCFCYHVGSQCTCMGAFPLWSQVVGELPGHGATASSGGLTAPGMPAMGYLPPPPGLPQMRAEAQVPGPRRPSAEATVAPVTEAAVTVAPVTEAAVTEAPVAEAPTVESAIMEEMPAKALTATPSLPAPMETGGVGDGPSWAEQVEEVEEEQFQHSRLAKHPCSLSRRWEPASWLPFPLQDYVGRFASVTWLYEHVAAQPAASHNVVGWAIRHLHPKLLPHQATSLGNQVACMIIEYHLTVSACQSSLHPILLPEATPLLPAIKNYVLGVSFEGTRDVRVMDHAVAL